MVIVNEAKKSWAAFACENPGITVILTLIICSTIKVAVSAALPVKVG